MKFTKILICGDSFCITDPDFPDLHWSEKILNFSEHFEILNLAHGGSSNAMIVLQLLQGLNLNPDFVILSFTNEHRYELDKDAAALPAELTAAELADYQKRRYTTNMYVADKNIEQWMAGKASNNLEKVKNYFYICFCLQLLQQKKIPFVFSLGGFEYKQDWSALVNSNYLPNLIQDHATQELKTNLWYYGNKSRPYFHVDREDVQILFANECISHINKIQEALC